MAHEILGERFISRVRPAWHGLGRQFEEGRVISASEAVREVAGDVEVTPRKVFYESDSGDKVEIPKHTAIVRSALPDDPQEKVFGIATERWHAISYVKLARFLDELSKTYKVETCGLIQDGSLCFLSLRGPDFSVQGDQMQDYFICNFSNQVGNSHKVMAAPVRVVCFNTNAAANAASSINLAVPHSANASERIGLAASLVAKFKEMSARTREIFDLFGRTPVTLDDAALIFSRAFPAPPIPAELRLFRHAMESQDAGALREAMGAKFNKIAKAEERHENAIKRVTELRSTARERFDSFDPTNLRGTAWAAYNAATEVSDWREGRGADVSSVWGTRAREKANAYAATLEVIGAN